MTEHKNVYAALAAAQANMRAPVKGSINPAFKSKYADLWDVMQAVLPALNAEGLALFHQVVTEDGHSFMRAILAHGGSDTQITCDVPLIVDRNNMQGFKSATTYAKRIGTESITGVAPADDDDGNQAAKSPPVVAAMSNGIADARENAVLDNLPDSATPRQKAEAYADAIIADFKGKGLKALSNAWDRWAKHIEKLEAGYPDLHERVVDAYAMRENELTEEKGIAAQ